MARMSFDEFNALPAAERISLRRFGQRSRLFVNDLTLVAATAAQVIPNDPDRLSLLVQNTGISNPATLTADGSKTVAQGDVIANNGGAYTLDALTDGEACGRELFGISTAGTTLHIEAVIGYGPVEQLPEGVTPL